MKDESSKFLDLSRSKQIIIKIYENVDLRLFIKTQNLINNPQPTFASIFFAFVSKINSSKIYSTIYLYLYSFIFFIQQITKYITLVSHRGKKYFHVNLIGHIFFTKNSITKTIVKKKIQSRQKILFRCKKKKLKKIRANSLTFE